MGTDIVGAQMAGIDSLLLLQGNSRGADWEQDAQQLQCSPNYVTDSLAIEVV
jgi:ribonucleotide monophosphatase NagD (HAD superfamily)